MLAQPLSPLSVRASAHGLVELPPSMAASGASSWLIQLPTAQEQILQQVKRKLHLFYDLALEAAWCHLSPHSIGRKSHKSSPSSRGSAGGGVAVWGVEEIVAAIIVKHSRPHGLSTNADVSEARPREGSAPSSEPLFQWLPSLLRG